MFTNVLLPIGLALLLLVLILFILLRNESRRQDRRLIDERRRNLGLPEGELVYEDADGQGEILSSAQYPLVGKPDYVVRLADGRLVPVELKLTVRNATAPYKNHEIQIAAYCLILEEYAEQAPTHGILRYADRELLIDYTPALRRRVLLLLDEMSACDEDHQPELQGQRATKCRVCTFQPTCPVGRGK